MKKYIDLPFVSIDVDGLHKSIQCLWKTIIKGIGMLKWLKLDFIIQKLWQQNINLEKKNVWQNPFQLYFLNISLSAIR